MRIGTIIGCVVLSLFLSGCSGCNQSRKPSSSSEKTSIKLGVIAGPESQLWETVKTIARDEHQLEIDLVVFNDYMTPNIALSDKSIDANAFQHEPYLNEMVQKRGLALRSVGKTLVFPIAAYSKKITSVDTLRREALIAIPNDPTNGGRALILLHKQGLIEVVDDKKLLPVVRDIIRNPLNLKIIELEAAQLPRALYDVDVAIINTTFASSVGLYPAKDGLFREGGDSNYVNIIAVRTEDSDASWVKKLVQSVQCSRVAEEALVIFEGAALPGWTTNEVHHD